MDTYPDDVVALRCEDAEHRVTQRAIGTIGRRELLDQMFLTGVTVTIGEEFNLLSDRFLKCNAIDSTQGHREHMAARCQAVGGNIGQHGAVAILEGLLVGDIGYGLAVNHDIQFQATSLDLLDTPVVNIDGKGQHFALLNGRNSPQVACRNTVIGITVLLNHALDAQVAVIGRVDFFPADGGTDLGIGVGVIGLT